MAYIYQITNDINQKIYIGKTEFSIEKRFKEHCKDAFKDRNEKRPLYAAMRKYGIEHFHIELLEETDNPEEREKFWIEEKGSFKHGYNATLGGDGRSYLDYDLIVKTYEEIRNIAEVSKILGIDKGSISKILHSRKIDIKSSYQVIKEQTQKTVAMLDSKEETILMIFPSTMDAGRWLIANKKTTSNRLDGVSAHITQVCNGKRNTAYKYKWKYL